MVSSGNKTRNVSATTLEGPSMSLQGVKNSQLTPSTERASDEEAILLCGDISNKNAKMAMNTLKAELT